MTIEQVIACIKSEKGQSSRFPVRVILINSLSQYYTLIHELSLLSDEVVALSSYCGADDIFPSIDRLQADVQKSSSSTILVQSMAEYLRLGYERELPGTSPQFAGLFNMRQDSLLSKKVLVPLYACEQIFEQLIGKIDQRRKEHVWSIDTEICEEEFKLTVYSRDFQDVLPSGSLVNGMRAWLKLWDEGIVNKSYALITKLHPYMEVAHGIYTTIKITGIFEYAIAGLEDGGRLKKEWGSEVNWGFLATFLSSTHTTTQVINKAHNVADFDAFSVLAKWNYLDENRQWLFWLWYQLNTSNDYISYAVSTAKHFSQIPQAIINAVFTMPVHEESQWLDERRKAIDLLKLTVDEKFFQALDSLPEKKRRLRLLNYTTHAERKYAIKTISQLLNEGASIQDVIRIIEDRYPLLARYLQPAWGYEWKELNDYFHSYKEHKLKNNYSAEINGLLEKTSRIIENIDTRYSLIKKFAPESEQTFILWVDGLGAEWSDLLISQILSLKPGVDYSIATGKAIIPTETEINSQWDEIGYPYKKLDKFDNLAHKGEPDDADYYSCVAKQLEVICDIAKTIVDKLADYNTVVITGDHGTSRLAALAFHNLVGIKPPVNSTPKSFGRYCVMGADVQYNDIHPSTKKVKNFIVFETHEHYMSSGNAAGKNDLEAEIASVGEIHGGMTPEEMLVPVIALRNKKTIKKISYTTACTEVQPNANGAIEFKLHFDSKVQNVQVNVKDKEASCTSKDGINWVITFKHLPFEKHVIDVYADNRLLEKHDTITVKTRGLIIDDF